MNMLRKLFLLCLVSVLTLMVNAETFVVAVGVANYKNISKLVLSENDAKTIAKLYKTKTRNVITMTGRYATRANIIKAMSDQFRRARKGDMVVLFFSGHGYEGGFCPYDMGHDYSNALNYDDIYAVFRKSNASRKVIIADACMSGGLRQEQRSGNSSSPNASDVVMFLSSRTNEYSIENTRMDNGFFTEYLEKGLRGGADVNRDRVITAKELFNFVSKGVKDLSRNRQHPVMWGNFDDNFIMIDWRKSKR